ncbi:hypothetical protein P154DRAFT_448872 [Amniculicola lignicola CBS 123094]|uniref:HNH nuclease domain-containing protein n=1 Tax=Amniculicola lignicola CBS 123094 TaxID=1392246 RepID=A0A6A5VZ32_9PLEO|nr:hypothetical protein P154DRAFT_448872 [Amniculicola lignicola CBS 123094]
MRLVREPCEPPAVPSRVGIPTRQILFHHPGYDDSSNVLLKLFASDVGQTSTARGLYAQYALQACGVVAGNRWDGWLSEAKDPDLAAAVDSTSILEKSSYYFHLPLLQTDIDAGHSNLPYPIVPTFREWCFPHKDLPELWKRMASTDYELMAPEQSFATSNLTLALQARDVSCRITGCREGTQVAHICPQKEIEWWHGNGMSRYNVGLANTLDDLSNALLLRTDLHIAFDKPKFVFVPKPSSDPSKPQLVTHLIEPSAEMEYLYHNRSLHPLHSSIETLFARFAWSIFPLLDAFLTGRERRRLLLATENGPLLDKDGFASWERCAQFSRKRSQSPKKRKPEPGPVTDDGNIRLSATADASRPRKRHRPSADSDNLELQLPSTALPPFTAMHNSADPTTLARTWLERERLRSDVHNTWEEDLAWAKEAWTGNMVLDEEKARKWLEISGAEFLESEKERKPSG